MSAERIVPGTTTWDECYFEHRQRYDFFANRCAGKRILDAACGVGYGSHLIAESGAESVVGIDVSDDAITTAKRTFSHPRVEFVQNDIHLWENEGLPFEVILSFETIEHVSSPGEFLDGLCSQLAPGGLLICSSPNILTHSRHPRSPTDNPHHLSETTYEEFSGLIGERLEIVEEYFQDQDPLFAVISKLEAVSLMLERSKVLGLENLVRRILGKELLVSPDLTLLRKSIGEQQTVIRKLEPGPKDWQKTFIIVAKKKS